MDVLVTEEIDSPAIRALAGRFNVVKRPDLWKDAEELKKAIASARTILVRNQTQLTAEILGAARALAAIGRNGVGLDNIDLPAASSHGIVVIAPLDANATSVAEFTLGLILGLARKIAQANRSTRAGGWDRKGCTGMELDGKALAICGFGRIGRKVAAMARGFGMRIIVYDPYVKAGAPALEETGASLASSLEECLAAADFVSNHSPLTPDTKDMFNARTFASMKRGSFFINISRGGVVDEPALADALRSGHLGGAALDVRESEPPRDFLGLEKMENVILTPHIASFSVEAQARTTEAVAADLERILTGQPAKNFVNFPSPKRERQ
jgi:D-3-phosphoglycerate dehydrogenase